MKLIVTVLIVCGICGTAQAGEKMSKEEKRGAVVGMVFGGAVGGPIGAGVGAIIGGGLIGNLAKSERINREQRAELADVVSRHQAEEMRLGNHIGELNADLSRLLNVNQLSLKDPEWPIQFRSNSSEIESHYHAPLEKVARVLTRNQDASVTLAGFADRRGGTAHNQTLSENRVGEVREFLLARGVREEQVLSAAYGEARPLTDALSREGDFFDRRVVVTMDMDVDVHLATR